MEDNEIPIQFDNYQSYGPPPSSNFGTGSTQGQAWYPPPAENEKVPAFDIATGLRLVNDPYLFTNGMQNQGQKYIQSLQPYFNVKKSYVLSKLKILLLPFLHNAWHRRQNSDRNSYLPPNLDINAPDLYIPLMAFVTYVLLVGFFMGTRFKFTPDVLGATSSTAVVVIIIEVILLKVSTWLWNFPPLSILELLAYSGYKFVGITLNIIAGITLGNNGFYIAFVLTSIANCLFLINSFKALFPTYPGEAVTMRKYFLACLAVLQVLSTLYLCYLEFNR